MTRKGALAACGFGVLLGLIQAASGAFMYWQMKKIYQSTGEIAGSSLAVDHFAKSAKVMPQREGDLLSRLVFDHTKALSEFRDGLGSVERLALRDYRDDIVFGLVVALLFGYLARAIHKGLPAAPGDVLGGE